MGPTAPEPRDYGPAIAEAVALGELNETSAESAPQQQVVNGWVAADLLEVIALENDAALKLADDRPAILLFIAVLAMCWLGATSPILRFETPTPIPSLDVDPGATSWPPAT